VRILFDVHLMEIGGSQLNAIELAEGARAAGHEVIVFGPPGELVDVVHELGLEFVQSPVERDWVSVRRMRALTRLARSRKVDVAHGFEWTPAIDLAFGPNRADALPIVITIMSMSVAGFLPRHVPLIVGTNELSQGDLDGQEVHVIEPWIEDDRNAPGVVGGRESRRRFDVGDDEVLVSVVCRLTHNLEKLDGVLVAMETVVALNDERADGAPQVVLLVVGGGEGLEEVKELAARLNAGRSTPAVVVAGPMTDPRAAYDAADIVIGMGSSALKGLAFEKPLVVQGASGYWETFDRGSSEQFFSRGFIGDGPNTRGLIGAEALRTALEPLRDNETLRRDLGRFGRDVIEQRFSLRHAVDQHLSIYARAIENPPSNAERRRSLLRCAAAYSEWAFRARTSQALARVTGAGERFGLPQWRPNEGWSRHAPRK
jgi:glycosyltransferase involved in cell wall biosynthesis